MKLLLTSSGISNTSIHNALLDLLGKPIAESNALCIPTAAYGTGSRGPSMAYQFITGSAFNPMCGLGWKSLGVLELTALPSIKEEHWVPMVQEADALLVWGGDVLYLCHWMRQSGLADLLPSLHETVYVGVSSGSMVLTPNFGEAYDDWFCREPPASDLPAGDDRALGLVDFAFFPHLDHERSPENSLANAERWAAGIPVPTYAIDDQSAIKVTDGSVEVVTEGHWKLFTPRTSGVRESSGVTRGGRQVDESGEREPTGGEAWPGGIAAITLFVDDLEEARRFYNDVFGLSVVFEDENSAVFRFGDTLVNLLRATEAQALVEPAAVASSGDGVRFQFTVGVQDVDAMCEELRLRGVVLLNGPMDRPWGIRTASFRDPGGHIWEIAQ